MIAKTLTVAALSLALTGCAGLTSRKPPIEVFPDMVRQGKYKPQAAGPFFADGRATRMPVPGTVAIGYLKDDEGFSTGMTNGMYIGRNPLAIDAALVRQGQRSFNIYCQPCHDRTGAGQGIVPQKSTWLPTNLHEPRVINMVDGEIYNIVTYGRRSMPGYRFQISERDRWAIVSYVRALQRARLGKVDDVPQDIRADLR